MPLMGRIVCAKAALVFVLRPGFRWPLNPGYQRFVARIEQCEMRGGLA
jgi:hypothetical protein